MFYFLIFLLLPLCAIQGTAAEILSFEEPNEIIITNRILAKVNGKSISVMDIMKRMDLFLQRYYPERMGLKYMRYQYYANQWRETLSQTIDQELMLADAEHLNITIADAEVREDILNRFGPNVMATLDNIGMPYEVARLQISNELIVQKIMWYRVHSMAFNTVNPQDIKEAYRLFCKKNPPLEKWQYQVLSIRSLQEAAGQSLAKRAFELLDNKRACFAALPEQLKTENVDVTVSLSPELEGDDKNLSLSHKEVLKQLQPGSFSPPIAQVSRSDNAVVHRIFFLKDHQIQNPPAFESMADNLKEQLLQQAFEKRTSQYVAKLRERYTCNVKQILDEIPTDFQPFAIR